MLHAVYEVLRFPALLGPAATATATAATAEDSSCASDDGSGGTQRRLDTAFAAALRRTCAAGQELTLEGGELPLPGLWWLLGLTTSPL